MKSGLARMMDGFAAGPLSAVQPDRPKARLENAENAAMTAKNKNSCFLSRRVLFDAYDQKQNYSGLLRRRALVLGPAAGYGMSRVSAVSRAVATRFSISRAVSASMTRFSFGFVAGCRGMNRVQQSSYGRMEIP